MNRIKSVMKKVVLGAASLSVLLTVLPSGNALAYGATTQYCVTNPPSSWSWNTTRTYSLTSKWCLHNSSKISWWIWQADGNLVWYVNNVPVADSGTWYNATTKKSGPNGAGKKLVAQNDGNIVVQDAAGHPLWGINRWSNWQQARAGDTITLNLDTYFANNLAYGRINYFIDHANHSARYSSTLRETDQR